MKYLLVVLAALLFLVSENSYAQTPTPEREQGSELDSLRKLEEASRDTIIFNSKYIRYTTLDLLKDRTQTKPIDTTLNRIHNYNPLIQPERPTIGLGNLGLPYRELLFNPNKSIGFDPGFHSMDIYRLTQDSLRYYRARTPFTSLYYVNGTRAEQILRIVHSQNIKPNWNVGGNYFRIGARGIYSSQNADHLNASLFTWYESPKKRYNILVNGLFNTFKFEENGSLLNDTVFTSKSTLGPGEETVRLGPENDPVRQTWKQKNFFLKQFYYIGRIDSLAKDSASGVLPTQRFSHALSYSSDSYRFYKNTDDPYNVFPDIPDDRIRVIDSTHVKNLRNEFMYSFYLRGRAVSFIKNELKLDVGLQHDLYRFDQMGYKLNFQNITFKGNLGYRFSDRVSVNGNIQQIFQGRNAGDFLYEAQMQFLLSKSVGKILLGAYTQNRSPEQLYDRSNYTYHNWDYDFDKTKVNNLSFAYLNPKFGFNVKAEYFLLTNYLYLAETAFPAEIVPQQQGGDISMLKLTLGKRFRIGKFNLESFAVYQKTDYKELLRVPEFYTYNSFYYGNSFFKKALTANLGFDVRMNTTYTAPSYAVNISQFYNGYSAKYSSYPIVDLWARFALRRANIFVRYDYANQGMFSKGYYTVNRYPMPSTLLKYGVIWNFYD